MSIAPRTAGIAFAFLLSIVVSTGCENDSKQAGGTQQDSGQTGSLDSTSALAANHSAAEGDALGQEIIVFCGACHVVPPAGSFPKDNWYEEVKRGYDFWFASRRSDIKPPAMQQVVDWYRERAPDSLPKAEFTNTPSDFEFVRADVTLRVPSGTDTATPDARTASEPPAVSFLSSDPDLFDTPAFLLSDMRGGDVFLLSTNGDVHRRFSGAISNPAAVAICDLNGNDQPDIVITDLGSFLPEDHDRGKLCWYPDFASDNPAEPVLLAAGLGRIADVRAADFDNDGDEDLVVAEFGWHTTGGIHLLMNQNRGIGTSEQFVLQTVDERSGPIHVPTVDLNNDGRMDFIALISQEFETVTAFLNEEDGFRRVPLFDAPDPAFGSSGIEIVDLDADGDPDVLLTNGDTFDSHLVKPYHGITWLENRGDLEFAARHLTAMPGVHRAKAVDLDNDGDLDVVASAFLSEQTINDSGQETFDSLIWMEQTEPGEFVRHLIQNDRPSFATIAIGDLDKDGDKDIAAGLFYSETPQSDAAIAVFFNQITAN